MTSKRLLTPIAKCLFDAADYIEKNGLWKGEEFKSVSDPFSPACMQGAIKRVAHNAIASLSEAVEVERAARRAVKARLGRDISCWNDSLGRTAEEAVEILRAVGMECAE